jgi:hypothetical protein
MAKIQDNVVSRATAALAQSVASIVNSGDDDVTKRYALAETFTEFQTYLDRNVGGDIVEKSGAHDLAGRLIEHLTDALGHKRRQHGFEKKEKPMESLSKIIKDAGFIAVANAMTDEGRAFGIDEHEFTMFATEHAQKLYPDIKSPAAAFAKLFTADGVDSLILRKAHAVVKASLAEQMFGPTFPAHAKADRSEGKAYSELMSKAEEYRNAHPELSISQAFEKVFTSPANIELAKRERVESAAR